MATSPSTLPVWLPARRRIAGNGKPWAGFAAHCRRAAAIRSVRGATTWGKAAQARATLSRVVRSTRPGGLITRPRKPSSSRTRLARTLGFWSGSVTRLSSRIEAREIVARALAEIIGRNVQARIAARIARPQLEEIGAARGRQLGRAGLDVPVPIGADEVGDRLHARAILYCWVRSWSGVRARARPIRAASGWTWGAQWPTLDALRNGNLF